MDAFGNAFWQVASRCAGDYCNLHHVCGKSGAPSHPKISRLHKRPHDQDAVLQKVKANNQFSPILTCSLRSKVRQSKDLKEEDGCKCVMMCHISNWLKPCDGRLLTAIPIHSAASNSSTNLIKLASLYYKIIVLSGAQKVCQHVHNFYQMCAAVAFPSLLSLLPSLPLQPSLARPSHRIYKKGQQAKSL